MDGARRFRADAIGDDRLRPTLEPESGLEGLEKVLRFSLPGEGRAEAGRERTAPLTAREMGQALDLVHEAAQSIRAADERARDSEARTQALLQRATEELKAAEARVHAAEMRARAADVRAQDAELRAREAENWLRQIFSTITEELPVRR